MNCPKCNNSNYNEFKHNLKDTIQTQTPCGLYTQLDQVVELTCPKCNHTFEELVPLEY